MYICGIGFAHDDVQDGNVAAVLPRFGRDHLVLGLEETTHDIEDGSFADSFGRFDIVAGERCVARLQEMAARGGDEAGDDADEIVVHVAGIAEGGG